MRNILIIGGGKSTSYLIDYFLKQSARKQLTITIADQNPENAKKLLQGHPAGNVITLNVLDKVQRQNALKKADIVVSMLPAALHMEVARDCIVLKKHLVTASYVSEQMEALHTEAKSNGLVFLNEIGVDPGIDHMSAMEVIDRIRNNSGEMILFESFTGGLVAPESDNNLWNYKFTWNPRNVVLAGQGGAAKFIQEGTYKYIPYHKLFRRTEFLDIENYGRFEAYANRDSLKYRSAYGLDNALTLYRGTMRRVGFSRAWNIFVQLGLTDDSYTIEDSENMSYREFINSFLPYSPTDSVELKMRHYLKIDQDDIIWEKLVELDLFNAHKKIGINNATPAQMLQKILEQNWMLLENDKDMIVMYHKFGYKKNGKKYQIDASMVTIGEDRTYTAMAKTVGLPAAIATLHILEGTIHTPGVCIPIKKEIYTPVLKELKTFDITFQEKEVPYLGYNPDNIAG